MSNKPAKSVIRMIRLLSVIHSPTRPSSANNRTAITLGDTECGVAPNLTTTHGLLTGCPPVPGSGYR
ncbi:hypothetical protein N7486_006715 [Penicillium sp. IBT 16267x]|nr:hypothetical protein N7486_006715 [Penicillium sp. IBT 16267x]